MERIKEAQPSKTFDRLNLPHSPLEGREGTGDTGLTDAGLTNAPSVHPLIPEKTQDILQTVLRRYRMWAFPLRKDAPALKFAKSCALYCKEALLNIARFSFIPSLFYGTRRFFSSLSFKNLSIGLLIPLALFSSLYINTDNSYSAPVLPAGGSFVYGTGGISSASGLMTITQSTPKAVINWQGFSIGANGEVFINNANGATLNRVVGPNISSIAGLLKSTGSVFLINPAGIVITPTGSVITGGSFLASALNISDSNFINSNYSFSGSGSVTNEGTIDSQGKVILVGQFVNNSGSITSQSSASLVSGSLVLIAPSGIMVSPSKGSVTNTGAIKAASAYLTSAGGNVYALSGNTGGIIEATGSKTVNGQIWLTAPQGTVSVNSKLQSDGSITIFGNNTLVGPSSLVSVSGNGTIDVGLDTTKSLNTDISSGASFSTGDNGLLDTSGENLSIGNINVYVPNGQWLLDPTDFTVDNSNNAAIDTALSSGSVTITTTASSASATSPITNGTSNTGTTGSIDIDAPLSWGSANALTLLAYDSINVDARITISGGGGLVLKYNNGNLPTPGTLNFPLTPTGFTTGSVQFTGTSSSGNPTGSLLIQGTPYTLVNANNIENITTGDYALATNINLPSSSFTPIDEAVAFTGTFNGLGNTVSNLDIGSSTSASTDTFAGLFGDVGPGGTVENVGVTNIKIYDSGNYVGGLVGANGGGTVLDSYATGSVSGSGDIGGLVGYNGGGVSDSYATGSVSGTGSSSSVGGLVGYNYSSSTVSNSYATGSVSGSGDIGGLVGSNYYSSTVSNSYATGSVSGSGDIGGLVGDNASSSTVSDSYATGSVSGTSGDIGGLVGSNGLMTNSSSGIVSSSYATGSVSGSGDIGGLVGVNYGSISAVKDSYATGSVSGSTGSDIGGLVGLNFSNSTVSNSYWDTASSGTSTGIGGGNATGATGLSSSSATGTSTMFQYTNFSGFNIYDPDTGTGSYTNNSGNSAWIQYNGYSFPLLRVFMHTLTVTANNASSQYNGSAYTTAPSGVTYSPSNYTASDVSGTLSYWDDATNSAPVNAGMYGLSGLYSTNQNGYIMIYNGTLTINKAPLTVTANNETITYNGQAFSGGNGVTYSSFAGGQTSSVLSGTLSYSGSSQAKSDVGTYTITPGGLTDANYNITYNNGTLTISPADLTVNANNDTITYNGLKFSRDNNGITATGLQVGDAVSTLGTPTYSGTSQGAANAGTYTITITPGSLTDTNYNITYNNTVGALTINQAPLSVTANNDTITYNGQPFSGGNGISTSGLQGTDSVSTLGTPAYSGSSQGAVNAGTYTIIPSGLTDANYAITYVNGALIIKQATFPDIFQAIYNQTGYSGDAAIVYESLSSYYASVGTTGGISQLLPYTGSPVIINDTYRKIRFFSITKEKKGRRLIKLFY